MRSLRFRGTAFLAMSMLLAAPGFTQTRRFHARFEPAAEPLGPVPIFADGFETGGTCNWVNTEGCTLYIFTIPDGTGGGTHPWPVTIRIKVDTELHIVNGDSTGHRVHTSGGIAGVPHQDSDMAPGQEYVATPTEPGTDQLYCHAHLLSSGATQLIVE